ncbi:MAG: carboxypeptidase-like regulatory domain-containing protein [Planctomycetaceae bacterium]|nr:carboxypeptidase-like regulatory domain-containing protein [Planctomycetaceae bacterium]
MKKSILLFIVSALLFCVGCGSGKVPLSGTVTLDDGTPLNVGAVIFATDTFSAKGNIDANGNYVMGTLRTNDGLPAGTYKVYIEGATTVITSNKQETSRSLIDDQYSSYDSTPLSCEVPVANNTFNIKIPKNQNQN